MGNSILWGQVHNCSSVLILPLHSFCPAPLWPLHRLQFFRINLLQCGLSMSHRGILAWVPGTPPPALTLVSAGLFLKQFSSLLAAFMPFLPFLKYVFLEVPLSWLRDSAVLCGGATGADCAWRGADHAAPQTLPLQLPCPVPGPRCPTQWQNNSAICDLQRFHHWCQVICFSNLTSL